MNERTTAYAYPRPALTERALDLLFPPVCVGCRRIGRWICPHCWPKVTWLGPASCARCGRSSPETPCIRCAFPGTPIQGILAVAAFEGVARDAVHAFKFSGRFAMASLLGTLMADAARELPGQVIVPVPLHPARKRERGYDQAHLLARAIARSLNRRLDESTLERTRKTRQQATLDPVERQANVDGAFSCRGALSGEHIVLIDDVSTTGATLDAAARALTAAGAGPITGLVFAHPLRRPVTDKAP